MFNKLVAIEPVSLIPSAEEALHQYAKEVVLYRDIPASDDQIVQRIGDADAVLLSYTSRMDKSVIERCPNIRYIGMCCSLYSEESANVDIAYARTRGIKVLGIRDYGDRGVVEYVLHELTGILHGFGMPMLRDEPVEITGLKAGIIGLGVSGKMIADALQFMGADIAYYSRTRKPDAEAVGMAYKPLAQLEQAYARQHQLQSGADQRADGLFLPQLFLPVLPQGGGHDPQRIPPSDAAGKTPRPDKTA